MTMRLSLVFIASQFVGSASGKIYTGICPGNSTADFVLEGLNFSGKIAIVTGGDSGLGYATASALAKKGAQVIIATHNLTKGNAAADQIAQATGADVRSPWALDLASLASIRSFATNFLAEFEHGLNFLVNDAGIAHPSVMSKDGFELVFQVDYLGHFLLTELLLPALRSSSPSHVVNVASGAHENACEAAGWAEGCFKDFTYLPPPVVPRRNVTVHYRGRTAISNSSSYGIAKFLMIQHAAELAEREKNADVKAFSLTPGFVLTSMTHGWDPDTPWSRIVCDEQVHPDGANPNMPPNPCPFTADQGAAAIAACVAPFAPNGAYISRARACGKAPVVMHGMTKELRSELYNKSLAWVGLKAGEADANAEYV